MMRKKLAIALTVTLLALLLNIPLVLADTAVSPTATSTTSGAAPATSTQVTTSATTTSTSTDNLSSTSVSQDQPPVLDVNGKPISPGILPDSPFYWLSNVIEKVQLIFTFNPAQKTALVQHRALEKLAAAQKMVSKGKVNLAEEAFTEYSQKLSEAQAYLAQVKDANLDSTQQLQTGMAKTYAVNIQIISELLGMLPEKAASKLTDQIARSMEKTVASMDQVDKKQVESLLKKDTQNLKGKLDKEANAALADLQKSLGLATTDLANATLSNGTNDTNGKTNPGTSEAAIAAIKTDKVQSERDGEDYKVLLTDNPNQPQSTIGDERKTEIAKEREKGQQGEKEREEHQNENAQNIQKTENSQNVQDVPNAQNVNQQQSAQVSAPAVVTNGQKASKGGEDNNQTNQKGHKGDSETDD